jgi:hypothetical protein
MSHRCTDRLPDALHARLQREAEVRQGGVSDVIREALERLLGAASDPGAEPSKTPDPVPLSTPAPHDCGQTVLALLIPEVRARIEETARLLELSASQVMTALLIAQLPPSQPSPPVSTPARSVQPLLSWQEFKRRWQQSAAVLPATPAPGTAPPTADAGPATPSPTAVGVQPPSKYHYRPDAD